MSTKCLHGSAPTPALCFWWRYAHVSLSMSRALSVETPRRGGGLTTGKFGLASRKAWCCFFHLAFVSSSHSALSCAFGQGMLGRVSGHTFQRIIVQVVIFQRLFFSKISERERLFDRHRRNYAKPKQEMSRLRRRSLLQPRRSLSSEPTPPPQKKKQTTTTSPTHPKTSHPPSDPPRSHPPEPPPPTRENLQKRGLEVQTVAAGARGDPCAEFRNFCTEREEV